MICVQFTKFLHTLIFRIVVVLITQQSHQQMISQLGCLLQKAQMPIVEQVKMAADVNDAPGTQAGITQPIQPVGTRVFHVWIMHKNSIIKIIDVIDGECG